MVYFQVSTDYTDGLPQRLACRRTIKQKAEVKIYGGHVHYSKVPKGLEDNRDNQPVDVVSGKSLSRHFLDMLNSRKPRLNPFQ